MNIQIDKQTEKALQITELLNKVIAFSEIGNRLHKNFRLFKPSQKQELLAYYEKIHLLHSCINNYPDLITTLGSSLSHLQWIQKSLEDSKSKCLELHEIFEIKFFIFYYQKIINYLQKKNIQKIIPLRDFSLLFEFLDREKQHSPTFHLNPAYSPELQKVYDKMLLLKAENEKEYQILKNQLIAEFNLFEFNGKITLSRMNKEYLERFNACHYLQIESENFANITYILKKNEPILRNEEAISELKKDLAIAEKNARFMISNRISENAEDLLLAFQEIADFDLLLAKAIFAKKYQASCPKLIDEYRISLQKSQNLILKDELKALGMGYQAVDVNFHKKVVILTGANMAGKTSILKTIAQAQCLLLYGIPIPAENAELFIPDFIHFSGPLTHEHRADLSSFALEVVNLQALIEKTGKGLILMDEFARGTNPEEGTALSQALISYFSKHNKGLFITATHFTPPAHLKHTEHFRLIGISDEDFEYLQKKDKTFLKENLKEIHKYFNYQMQALDLDIEVPKSAFKIAELLGLDDEILEESKKRYQDEIQNIY